MDAGDACGGGRDPDGLGDKAAWARERFIVGIDLGTTSCAVVYADTRGRERLSADLRLFEVPQLLAPARTIVMTSGGVR